MTIKKVIILGAASAIAEQVARLYAVDGAALLLAARDSERLAVIARDLSARGAAQVETETVDFLNGDAAVLLPAMVERLGGLDHVLLAWGITVEQKDAEQDFALAARMIETNFTAATLWALAAANILEARGQGSLIALGSPAGDRGRRYNFVYGASKAGLATLMEGISHRFAAKSTRLKAVLIKPGPTDTPMTAPHKKGGPLWSRPEHIAPLIRKAVEKGAPVAYVPGRWRLIMKIIRTLPRFVFNRMDF